MKLCLQFMWLFLNNLLKKLYLNKSYKSYIINHGGIQVWKSFLRLEDVSKKYEKCKLDSDFLRKCLDYDVFPKFLNFKLWNPSYCNSRPTAKYKRRLLSIEIQRIKSKEGNLEKQKVNQLNDIKSSVSLLTSLLINLALKDSISKYIKTVTNKHQTKFNNLARLSLFGNGTITNLSSYNLNTTESRALSRGLDFSYVSRKCDLYNIKTSFECMFHDLAISNNDTEIKNEFKSKIIQLSKLYTANNLRKLNKNFPKCEQLALKKLGKLSNLVFLKPDKGNGIVVMNKEDYISKANELLSDSTKFKVLANDNTVYLENKLNRLLLNLKKNGYITNECYLSLHASGSKPGSFYGLPKIHKMGNPLRPIISGIGTPCHKTAAYLAKYLAPLTHNDFVLKDTLDFVSSIKRLNAPDCRYMVSFDVTALFTSVPLNEVIELVLTRIYVNNELMVKFPKEDLRKLLYMCTSENCFVFNDTLYTQTDGVAMGSPLGPVLANIFMTYIENKIFNDNIIPELICWKRYVDDVFAVLKSKPDLNAVICKLNNLHPNIQFTYEGESSNVIHFMDVKVIRKFNGLQTCTYYKPTYTGLYTLWSSFVPDKFKFNIINCLLTRSFNICSDWQLFCSEVDSMRKKFSNLGYPVTFIESIIKQFMYKVNRSTNRPNESTNKIVYGPNKKKVFIILPYVGKFSNKVSIELHNLLKLLNCHDLHVIHKSYNTTRKMLQNSLKCNLTRSFVSGVVYKINCMSCSASYIGETKRRVSVRMTEHKLALRGKGHSSAAEHTLSTGHVMDFVNFSILSRDIHERRLKIKEALFINDLKPKLNDQKLSYPLNIFV